MEKFLERLNNEVIDIIDNYTDDKLDELYKKVCIINYVNNIESQKAQLELLNNMSSINYNQDLSKIDFNSIISAITDKGE